jgi:hypothetical protein
MTLSAHKFGLGPSPEGPPAPKRNDILPLKIRLTRIQERNKSILTVNVNGLVEGFFGVVESLFSQVEGFFGVNCVENLLG